MEITRRGSKVGLSEHMLLGFILIRKVLEGFPEESMFARQSKGHIGATEMKREKEEHFR